MKRNDSLKHDGRRPEFDIMKGFGILMVVLGHVYNSSHSVTHIAIYGFHMPLFFFVSGYFHKKRPFREQLTKDLERLFIPWLFFSLLLLATHIFISIVGRGLTEGVIHELGKINPLDEHCWVLYHIIWFIVCLFLVRQIYAVISIIGGEILCLPLYIIGFALHYYGINLPFFIDTAFSVLIFYGAGHFFHEHQNKLFSCIGICALIFFYISTTIILKPFVNLCDNVFPIHLVLSAMTAILAIYQICIYLSKKIGGSVEY